MREPDNFKNIISALCDKANISGNYKLETIKGGRNNQTFCVSCDNGTKALLKYYFNSRFDKRNRLASEHAFLKYLRELGYTRIPRVLAVDTGNNLGLYEYIEGKKLSASEIGKSEVDSAIDFFCRINNGKYSLKNSFYPASEACFNLNDHIRTVETRISKLSSIAGTSGTDRMAREFIKNKLIVLWDEVRQHVLESTASLNMDLDKDMPANEKCLSPSDFGFHNALKNSSGEIYFFDFEYAGIDDPSRMMCDFFCQPEIPVPFKFFHYFIRKICSAIPYTKEVSDRAAILFPVYKLKWCCILLNEFLQDSMARRKFAISEGSPDLKLQQLNKALKYMENFELIKNEIMA